MRSWLLEVGFYCFSAYSCHFGREFCYFGCPKPIIWYACWLHFTTLGPFCHFSAGGHPRGLWEQQEGHVGVRNKIFIDFGLIFGLRFDSFLGFDGLNSMFVLGLFPGDFLHRFSNRIIDSWSSQNKVFGRKVLHKPCFRENRFLVIREQIFSVFGRPWGWFF